GIIRMGLYESAKRLHGYPITPGFEVAGRVAAVGSDVREFGIGDPVIGLTLFGGYASRVVLSPDRVFKRPTGMPADAGAAIPTIFLTAWWMVHELLHPHPGDTWLVHSAAGGVGSALAQLGRLAGCRVIGVVGGAHKREAALAAGCDAVIDKARDELWLHARTFSPAGYQAIFDANGVSTLGQSYRYLAPTGRLLIYGFASMLPHDGRLNWFKLAWDWLRTPRYNPLSMTRDNKSVLACNLSFLSGKAERLREGMLWLLERFADGRLTPPPITTFPLDRAADAQRAIESGRTVGKLVLLP
ncbi:MAG TPA: zinc-binding dehydrogenase, partial [Xanthomonadales bacterium]|nr:zinc-binding dehydrogenase [Xanthomonadales bacterium]